MKAPASEPSPPITTITNTMLPSTSAIPGKVVSTGPAITPATPANAVPTPNTPIKISGTLWPRLATMAGWVMAA